MKTKTGITVGIIAMAGALASCGRGERAKPSEQPDQESVVRLSADSIREAGIETAVVEQSRLGQALALTGTLAAKPWTPEEQAAVNAAESADAKRELAEANFRRLSRLYSDGITARQDLDAARAEKEQAEAAAAQADAARANLGLSAASSAIEGRAAIWGLASLADIDLSQVKPDAPVDVTTAAFPGEVFSGRVVEVSRSEDPETRSFTVRIAIADAHRRLHPQMLATFSILTSGGGTTIVVPRPALLLEGAGSYVYVADGNAFRRQRVVTGAGTSDRVQVISGLSVGQRVVVAGAQTLESERLKAQLKPPNED